MANNMGRNAMGKTVSFPMELYESIQGRYFVGLADNLNLNSSGSAWARLYNPRLSGVNLFVDRWSAEASANGPYCARIWLNADPPGNALSSTLVSPGNLAFRPAPLSAVSLQKASNVYGEPDGGTEVFSHQAFPGSVIAERENGRFIFPPGGSFLIFVTLADAGCSPVSCRISFGWWEERIP